MGGRGGSRTMQRLAIP
uniref:Uncharacterized protein n=1 Tax=Anguilla anguilla TaxID=7936 RepID=A0A0E9QWJ8_ANGAN